jgi:DNA-binding transcriptional LysR family regulator
MRLPSLSGLRAFEALGRTGSLKAASEELGVSPTVLSRHVRNLQFELKVQLTAPHGRGLRLTSAGEAFHAQIGRAFDTIRRANQEIRPTARRALRLWSIPGIANRCLLPRLPLLQSELGDFEIDLYPTIARPNLIRGDADAEVICTNGLETTADVKAELIAHPQVHAVVSPAFKARHPQLKTPADFLDAALIHEASTLYWEQWFEFCGIVDPPVLRGPRLWHADLAIEAARLGQGVALANSLLVADDLASGRLLDISPVEVRLGGYYFITPARRWRDAEIIVLRRWVKEALQGKGGTNAFSARVAAE